MRAAPAVDAALGAGRLERMLITLLWGAAGAALALWGIRHAEWPDVGAVLASWMVSATAALAMAAAGAWLARRALPAGPSRLGWDGTAWFLHNQDSREHGVMPLGRLVVALDLGHWVLLKLHPVDGGASLWRVASARSAGADWHGLRVALQAHAGAARPLAGGPGAPP